MFKTYLIQYYRIYDLVSFLAHLGLEIAKVVRYEDLVANMVNVTRDLYKFAGLGWSSIVKWISTLENNSKYGRAYSVLRNAAIHKIMTCEISERFRQFYFFTKRSTLLLEKSRKINFLHSFFIEQNAKL